MNRIQLFRLLRHNNNLSYRRSPAFEQGMVAKVLMGIGAGIFVIYLLAFGTMFGFIAAHEMDEPTFIAGLMPYVLMIDFFLRFMVQQTPDVLAKPYMLLPLPRNSVIETFLVSSLLSSYNWLWLCFFIPYAIVVWAGGGSFLMALSIVVVCQLLLMANSQFYLLVRTLLGRSMLWWFLPIVVYGSVFIPLLIDWNGDLFERFTEKLIAIMRTGWWMLPATLLLLVAMFFVNRKMQFAYVYEEVSGQEKKPKAVKHVYQFSFLDRFGQTGEYLKLEIKSLMRNKAMRMRFWTSVCIIVVFTLLIAYTPIYDGMMNANFWCFYCFAIYGITSLVKVMGPEGNYIDLLMVHRENILSLLHAKYYFHCAILLLPCLLMLPAIIEGKFSILMVLAYMFLSSGLLYFIMFQLAISNKQTMPLDQKLTGKGNIESGWQLILELVAMFLPIVLVTILIFVFNERTAYIVLASLGLLLTLAHPWWLRNIYQRMMKRRYENLEGFRATR